MRCLVLAFLAALSIAGNSMSAPAAIARETSAPAGKGMVSAADPRAAAAGTEILRQGGSAAEAAIATMVALTVVEPQSSGIGGGGFLVYAAGGKGPATYDGRETAPAAASPQWFYKDGVLLGYGEAIPGGKSVGVPGNIRMAALAHARS